MTSRKMHVDEADIDSPLVRRLLVRQFPRWADLPVERCRSDGTDNAIFRLGDDMAVRLPRVERATGQVEMEHRWLPRLAPLLPLPIPVPLAKGLPAEGYAWPWSIYRWIGGETATVDRVHNQQDAATRLGRFVAAMQRIDLADGPIPGPHNSFRGGPLPPRDAPVRHAIAALGGAIDGGVATDAWTAALEAPVWQGQAVWIHGDLQAGNLLAREGKLSAVIDFGTLSTGDPACDVMAAWTYLSAETRGAFRAELQVDEATWARARGWALSFGLIALAYYQTTNPGLAGFAQHAVDEVLADHRDAS
jgi:aminoglycoside phosphotransferase (APT) family kinase protein